MIFYLKTGMIREIENRKEKTEFSGDSNMDTPLFNALLQYKNREMSRFHMPGHKGKGLDGAFAGIAPFDVTEIPGMDSLYDAGGVIARCEENIAGLYGSKGSLISASGSTLCIMAMLSLCAAPGQKVVMGRNLHRAALNAAALIGFEPVFVYPETEGSLFARYTPEAVERVLRENPDASAVYITSPDYYGVLSDVGGIKAVCRRFGVPLLVDNAHGAALRFMERDLHPITLGADLCCDSFHKTLPAFTGAACLHIGNGRFLQGAKSAMALFGTTSPSYLIMASMDLCAAYLAGQAKEDFRKLAGRVEFLEKIAREKKITTLSGGRDYTRLTLYTQSAGYPGWEADKILQTGGIQSEYADGACVVLMASPFLSEGDYSRLERVLRDFVPKAAIAPGQTEFPVPVRVMTVRQAAFSPSELVPVSFAEGRIAAESKALCPPGVPVVTAGERITAEIKKSLQGYGIKMIKVVK